MKVYSVVALYFIFMTFVIADLKPGVEMMEQRLEQSLKELSTQRKSQQDKLKKVSEDLSLLRIEESALKENYEEFQSLQDSKIINFDDIKAEVKKLEKEIQYFSMQMKEFLAEEQVTVPSYDPLKKDISDIASDQEAGVISEAESLRNEMLQVHKMTELISSYIGGRKIQGEVLSERGEVLSGTLIDIGTDVFFYNDQVEGRVLEYDHDSKAKLWPEKLLLKNWSETESKFLGLDISRGDFYSLIQQQDNFLEHLKKGGLWIYPILGFAFLSSLIAFLKCVSLFSVRVSSVKMGEKIANYLIAGKVDEAKELVKKEPKASKKMWSVAIENGRSNAQLSEDLMAEVILEYQPKFERYLSFIAVTATIAPLLGLLGTVTGIIKTFQMMEVHGMGNPKPLISGISEALITTEFGLVLAIPALLMYTLLSRKSSSLIDGMERAGMSLVNQLKNVEIAKSK